MAKFYFKGMNTVKDPSTLNSIVTRDSMGGECVSILNMDADDSGGLSTRKAATSLAATACHSGWSHDGVTAYLVIGNQLCKYDGTNAVSLASVQPLPMSYCQVNDVVVCSNGVDYLIIENGVASLPVGSTEPFKVLPPAGQHLTYYNGRLYIARDNTIIITDPFTVDYCDERQMFFPIANDPITGIAAIDNGVFIGTTKETFFLGGSDPIVGEGSLQKVCSTGVIKGTMISCDASLTSAVQFQGRAALWASPDGFCAGGNSGTYVNLSDGVMALPDVPVGASMLREQNGLTHFIAVLGDGAKFNQYTPPTFEVDEGEL